MKIETTQEYCSYFKRADEYTIQFEVKTSHKDTETVELSFTMWSIESDNETDAGTDFDEKSQEIYDSLSEETQEEIDDYIHDIKA